MKRKQGFAIMKIAGEYMAVPTDADQTSFRGAAILNEVSAFLLNAMETDISEDALLEKILREYAVDRDTAQRDLREILCDFEKLGLIQKSD